jgi:hypothetical protein
MKYVKFVIGGASILATALGLAYHLLSAGSQGLVVLVAAILPLALALFGTFARATMPRWAAVTSAVSFLLVAMKTREGADLQNIMMAAVLGLLAAITLAIRPEETR